MFPYIPNGVLEEKEMLDSLGLNNIENLFDDVPENLKFKNLLNINKPLSENEVKKVINSLAKKNKSIDDLVCFLGAGAYDHSIPSIIDHVISRSEFYTAYTPYQPEISQGTLAAIFEFQTMICNLTNMDIANASMYDGATATAEAAIMASASVKGDHIIISPTINPQIKNVLKTYMKMRNIDIVEVKEADGVTDVDHLKSVINKNTIAIIGQSPNFYGIIEDFSEFEKLAKDNKALFIMNSDPIALSILKTPGEYGADIAVGEAQVLGNSLSFGGPYVGFLSAKDSLIRKIPGRIVGQSLDVDNKRAFVLTLQAREQHIRREKASSNICSNQALSALIATIYMATLGKEGIKKVAQNCVKKSYYAKDELLKTNKFSLLYDKPFFREFALKTNVDVDLLNNELLSKGILGGYKLSNDSMLMCVTEKRSKEEIDYLVKCSLEIGK